MAAYTLSAMLRAIQKSGNHVAIEQEGDAYRVTITKNSRMSYNGMFDGVLQAIETDILVAEALETCILEWNDMVRKNSFSYPDHQKIVLAGVSS